MPSLGTSPGIRQNDQVEQANLRIRCACGWEVRGTEDEVVLAIQEHGLRLHNMAATRDEVLAIATADPPPQPADEA